MAVSKKNTTTEISENKQDVIVTQNEETVTISRSELEAMKAQINLMMQSLSEKNNKDSAKRDRYITFINLTKGRYVVKGNSTYVLDGQFAERKFLEKEARIIVNNMPNSIRQGKIYIADSEFVKDCDLEDYYENLLNDTQLINLLNHDASYVVEVYKNACEGQKKIIIDLIEEKKLNSEKIDANILIEIGKLSGKDLINIAPINDD